MGDGDDAEIEELEEEKRKLNAPPPTPALDEEKTGQRQTSGEISTKASSRQTSPTEILEPNGREARTKVAI